MALTPKYVQSDNGQQIAGYTDDWGQQWRQGANGWERYGGQDFSATGWSPDEAGTAIWTAGDPNKSLGFDTSPYQSYLNAVLPQQGNDQAFYNGPNPNQAQNPWAVDQIFNTDYGGRGGNTNPYASLSNRDALRTVAQRLGLSPQEADRAALEVAQSHYNQFGGSYSEGTHPAIIGDQIAQKLFAQAGRPYQGLSQDQIGNYVNTATKYEQNFNDINASAWKGDSIGGAFAFLGQVGQDRWEALLNDPERAATPGPISTWIQNKLLNKDNAPVTDLWGGASTQDYQEAAKQGIDTNIANQIQFGVESMLAAVGSAGAGQGLISAGMSDAEAATTIAASKAAAASMTNNADTGDALQNILTAAATSGGAGELAGEFGYGDYSGAADTAAKAAKSAADAYRAYNTGNIGGIAGQILGNTAGGLLGDSNTITNNSGGGGGGGEVGIGTTKDAFGPGSNFDLMDGPLTSNSNSALDLLPKQEDKTMSLENDGWSYNASGDLVPSDPNVYTGDPNYNQWDFQGVGSDGQSSWLNSLFPTTSDAYGSGSADTTGSGGGGGGGSLGGLGSILGGAASGSGSTDYTRLLGALGAAGLGAYGANQQANAYKDVAQQYMGMGSPYRDKLAALYANPNSFLSSQEVQAPVQQGTDALARSLSIHGNPAGSGFALQNLQDYSANQLFGRLGEEKNRLAQMGGLSQFAAAAPQASMAGIGAQGGVYNALGYGLGQATNPQTSMNDILMQLARNNGSPGLNSSQGVA